MKMVFSTAEIHPRDRFDCWHRIVCRTMVEHDAATDSRRTFRAQLQAGALADIGLLLFEISPITVTYTARHAAQARGDDYFLYRQVAGRATFDQDGREFALAPGDVVLFDPRLPLAGRFGAESRMLILKIPRHLLEARIGNAQAAIAPVLRPAAETEHSLASIYLGLLPDHVDGLGPTAAAIVKEQMLDLVALSLAKATDAAGPRVSSTRSLVLLKLRAAIEARLADPKLDAAAIAAGAGVSVRYANAVLAESDMSIMRLVQARRLARCRRALEDPAQGGRTMSEIAYGWGFSDMTHFGRKFREAYGLLPSEYRRRTKHPDDEASSTTGSGAAGPTAA
jgi:AraC-like DNA-binding protein